MEPGSCTPSQYQFHYLVFFLLFFIVDMLLIAVFSVFRYYRSNKEDSEQTDERYETEMTEDSPSSPRNMNLLLLISKLSGITLSILTIVLLIDSFCLLEKGWAVALLILLVPQVLLVLEGIMSGIASRNAVAWAPRLHGLARLIIVLFGPFYRFYDSFKPADIRNKFFFNEMEARLREWVNNPPDDTPLKADERKMVRSILHFSDTLIREIMIPRIDMTAIDVDTCLDEAAATVLSSGHSRLPVYDDEIDNIIGVLYAKDLLKAYREVQNDAENGLHPLLRPALFVPEAKKAGDLLSEMQASGTHMVIVVDEYGGTAGIVSMEDIVEEIVGEIRDEFDETEEELVREIGDHEYSFLGRIDLEDVNEMLGTHITREAADTLAGFLYSRIGKVPVGDEKIVADGWQFQVEELSGNRIRRVSAVKAEEAGAEDEENDYIEEE